MSESKINAGSLASLGFEYPAAQLIADLADDTGYDRSPVDATVFAGRLVLAGLLGVAASLNKLAKAYEGQVER